MILEDRPDGAVVSLSQLLPPSQQLLHNRELLTGQCSRPFDAQQLVLLGAAVEGHVFKTPEFLASPVQPVQLRQAVLQLAVERQQVLYVLGRVVNLRASKGAFPPVGQGFRLVQADMKSHLHQLLKADGVAVPDEAGRDLHVKNTRRHLTRVVHRKGEILLPGVDNRLDGLVVDQAPERA